MSFREFERIPDLDGQLLLIHVNDRLQRLTDRIDEVESTSRELFDVVQRKAEESLVENYCGSLTRKLDVLIVIAAQLARKLGDSELAREIERFCQCTQRS